MLKIKSLKVEILSDHTREEIDHWLTKFPADQRRSAVLGALSAAQHQNNGFLTTDLMDAVADFGYGCHSCIRSGVVLFNV